MSEDVVCLHSEDFEDLLAIAAERGARKALAEVGLDGPGAKDDIAVVRGMASTLRSAACTAWQTAIRITVTAMLGALALGLLYKINNGGK